MQGVRFEDLEATEDILAKLIRMYENDCLAMGIQKLLSRWRLVLCWDFTAQSTQWGHVKRSQFT